MKALILAAGLGTRLAPLTDNYPKAMVEVSGKPILFKQIENLTENGVRDIIVIAGYKADVLEQRVHEAFPWVRVVDNKDYETTNNMYSAYMGGQYMAGDDFLMMNADVFFDASVITALLAFDAPNAIVTDIGAYLEESMKVVEEGGALKEISKLITKDQALGASIDVYKFSPDGGRAFFDKCADYIDTKGQLKLWSEVALNDILSEVEFKACPLKGRWFEIDTLEDLDTARDIFAS